MGTKRSIDLFVPASETPISNPKLYTKLSNQNLSLKKNLRVNHLTIEIRS